MRVRWLCAWALAASALFVPSARAQETWTTESAPSPDVGADEVELKNGGVVRGTIISVEPGKDVVIQVHGTPEPRRFAWDEVANVERGKYAPSRDRGAPKANVRESEPVPEPRVARSQRGLVRLRIVSDDDDVYLHEMVGVSSAFDGRGHYVVTHSRPVCRAPCNEVIDGRQGQQYFFTGEYITDSKQFTLADRQGAVTADVDAGSKSLRGGAYAVVAIGGVMAALGIVGTVVAYTFPQPEDAQPNELADAFKVAGPVVLGVGVAALVGAIFMFDASSTRYELKNGTRTGQARWWLGEF